MIVIDNYPLEHSLLVRNMAEVALEMMLLCIGVSDQHCTLFGELRLGLVRLSLRRR